MFYSLWPHESQHARPPFLPPTPGVYSNSCPLSWWCHPNISSSVVPFSSRPQSLPGSFPMSQLFTWGGQSIGISASASVLPMNIQDWSPLGWTGWISLQSKGISRVFSNTTVQKHQFFGAQLSSQSNSNIHTWPLKKTIALTRQTFVGNVMSQLFIYLFLNFLYLFMWLHQVSVGAHGIFQLWHVGSSSPPGIKPKPPALGATRPPGKSRVSAF